MTGPMGSRIQLRLVVLTEVSEKLSPDKKVPRTVKAQEQQGWRYLCLVQVAERRVACTQNTVGWHVFIQFLF